LEEIPKPKTAKQGQKISHVKKDIVDDHAAKKLVSKDELSTIDEAGDMTIYRTEVLRRAKDRSQDIAAEMIHKGEVALWLKSATCHICHYKRGICLTFHCGKHSYCGKHCKERLGLNASDYDPHKHSNVPINYCPICAVSCKCSKCLRNLDSVARDTKRCCVKQSREPVDAEMNVFELFK